MCHLFRSGFSICNMANTKKQCTIKKIIYTEINETVLCSTYYLCCFFFAFMFEEKKILKIRRFNEYQEFIKLPFVVLNRFQRLTAILIIQSTTFSSFDFDMFCLKDFKFLSQTPSKQILFSNWVNCVVRSIIVNSKCANYDRYSLTRGCDEFPIYDDSEKDDDHIHKEKKDGFIVECNRISFSGAGLIENSYCTKRFRPFLSCHVHEHSDKVTVMASFEIL